MSNLAYLRKTHQCEHHFKLTSLRISWVGLKGYKTFLHLWNALALDVEKNEKLFFSFWGDFCFNFSFEGEKLIQINRD